jgi:hypothetical protein
MEAERFDATVSRTARHEMLAMDEAGAVRWAAPANRGQNQRSCDKEFGK